MINNLLPFNYLLILIAENVIYLLFVYLVFTKTKGDTARRWKASVICSFMFGQCLHLLIIGLSVVGWLTQVNFDAFINDFRNYLSVFIPGIIGFNSLIIMPVIFLGTFFAYFRFEQSGDRLIEKYWRNPKIKYEKGQKPPFLKF